MYWDAENSLILLSPTGSATKAGNCVGLVFARQNTRLNLTDLFNFRKSEMTKKVDYFSLFARIAIALSFLSAVADRIGLWTPLLGNESVVWGNMANFIAYTGSLSPWVPVQLLPPLAWAVTVAEAILGIFLIIGFQKRMTALLSGILLLAFAFSMMLFSSIKAPFDYSVFTAAACAFLLYKNSK